MLADYLLPGIVIALVAWPLVSSMRVRRRLPELVRERVLNAGSWRTLLGASTPPQA
jgi:hypothetical protein